MIRDQYPINPQGPESGRLIDPSVTAETSFNEATRVQYGSGETTLLFEKPGDGFQIGWISDNKYADGFSQTVIRTQSLDGRGRASYVSDMDTLVRQSGPTRGRPNSVTVFEKEVLGSGVSGLIGQPIQLPGAKNPELVTSVELRWKGGPKGDRVENRPSPFVAGAKLLENARKQLDRKTKGIGSTAVGK